VQSKSIKAITAVEIQEILKRISMHYTEMRMHDVFVQNFTSINKTSKGGVSYLKDSSSLNVPIETLKGLIFFSTDVQIDVSKLSPGVDYICVEDPKYVFSLLYQKFHNPEESNHLPHYSTLSHHLIHPTAKIAQSSRIHENVVIGMNAVISDGVVIHDSTVIGDNVCVKANSVIGGTGFGYAVRRGHPPLKIPHFGGVVIGNNVDIGSCNTIDRGTFEDTIIGESVKTDNGVHIAHNVRIGDRTLLTAHVEISGSVNIGSDTWIAPKAAIKEKIRIGNNVLVGIGSVVINDIPDNCVVAGVPARLIRERI
jgi:UDP-3-O-[3-hydroxymyristoyl] glucosamine N-acyltransferase